MPGGAPRGNQNAVRAKRWQQAIDRALDRRSKAAGIEELDRLADKFLDAVEAGGISSKTRGPIFGGYMELADRLDGKAAQSIEVKRGLDEFSDNELAGVIDNLRSALSVEAIGSGTDTAGGEKPAENIPPV